jgi:hypothetical protein
VDLEVEDGAHMIQEGHELLQLVAAHQEHILHLCQIRQGLQVMKYQRVPADYREVVRFLKGIVLGNRGGGREMEKGRNLVLDGSQPIIITAFIIFLN